VETPILQAISQALDKLKPIERDLLMLKVQNYSYDEIAKLLSIENNQLKVKHHRAKNKLVKLLKEIYTYEQPQSN
jgi:RNA polymerase sigma factor (sigma-70 family)